MKKTWQVKVTGTFTQYWNVQTERESLAIAMVRNGEDGPQLIGEDKRVQNWESNGEAIVLDEEDLNNLVES